MERGSRALIWLIVGGSIHEPTAKVLAWVGFVGVLWLRCVVLVVFCVRRIKKAVSRMNVNTLRILHAALQRD